MNKDESIEKDTFELPRWVKALQVTVGVIMIAESQVVTHDIWNFSVFLSGAIMIFSGSYQKR